MKKLFLAVFTITMIHTSALALPPDGVGNRVPETESLSKILSQWFGSKDNTKKCRMVVTEYRREVSGDGFYINIPVKAKTVCGSDVKTLKPSISTALEKVNIEKLAQAEAQRAPAATSAK
ncbi:MAG: hypothetical protein CL678_09970 [Bdellovibrionaceae bacterium]|nr:hypothetical protein [Pseudobdellovibrionaceae bacterium]